MPLYQSGAFPIAATGSLGWSDALFVRDTANAIAQRNGTNAQSFYVYNTYTDASNYERAGIEWSTTANTLTIGTQAAGTGTGRQLRIKTHTASGQPIIFAPSGTDAWQMQAGGAPNLVSSTDLTVTIGLVAANRPLAVYAGYYGSQITSQAGTTYTAAASDSSIIFTSASTVTLTLPAAASFTGRKLHLKTTGGAAVNSATSNVVAKAGGAAAAPILGATAGTWAELQSDGTNWIVMAGT